MSQLRRRAESGCGIDLPQPSINGAVTSAHPQRASIIGSLLTHLLQRTPPGEVRKGAFLHDGERVCHWKGAVAFSPASVLGQVHSPSGPGLLFCTFSLQVLKNQLKKEKERKPAGQRNLPLGGSSRGRRVCCSALYRNQRSGF